MRSIIFTAPSSNMGKTTVTLGIIRAIKNKGYDVSAFKTGPDFIDLKYLEFASGKKAGNLDIYLMGDGGIKKALGMNCGQYGIIEGAMGYFDGIFNTFENSSFHISEQLNIPAVLIYTPKGEMFSAIPKIKGMVEFSNFQIKGIILNKVNEYMFLLLKEKIEEYIDVEMLGYLPYDVAFEAEYNQLGLIRPQEDKFLEQLIYKIATTAERTINIDRILQLAEHTQVLLPDNLKKRKHIKAAIAYDEAFNFYYNENLNLLNNVCQTQFFSPIKDKKLPESDLIYIGGGYPELFKGELSSNADMINSIKEAAEEGKFILAESGGFMYLVSSIEGNCMCNIFNAHAKMTDKLQRFGYVNMEMREDTILGEKGTIMTGHEYHRSVIDINLKPLFNISKPRNADRNWQCGYSYKNTLAYCQHINFIGNKYSFNYLLDKIEGEKRDKNVY